MQVAAKSEADRLDISVLVVFVRYLSSVVTPWIVLPVVYVVIGHRINSVLDIVTRYYSTVRRVISHVTSLHPPILIADADLMFTVRRSLRGIPACSFGPRIELHVHCALCLPWNSCV